MKSSGKRKISMSLQGCCGNGADVIREMTYEQYEYMSTLAKELTQNDGHSTDFTVPYFYVSDWEEQ